MHLGRESRRLPANHFVWEKRSCLGDDLGGRLECEGATRENDANITIFTHTPVAGVTMAVGKYFGFQIVPEHHRSRQT